MTDFDRPRAERTARVIDVADERERRAWTERLCLSPDELDRIVAHVGPRVERVEDYLRRARVVHA